MAEAARNFFKQSLPSAAWDVSLFGNTLGKYAEAAFIFLLLLLFFYLVKFFLFRFLGNLASKTKTDVDDAFLQIAGSLRPPFYIFLAFYFSIQSLELSGIVEKIITGILIMLVVYQVVRAIQIFIDFVFAKKIGEKDKEKKSALGAASTIIKIILWVFGGIFLLSNLGVEVTSLIAGLGIGGIAVAFALQNILSDLFSSFAIYLDKPFEVGDFISVDQTSGVIERIGIKTTRIRALQGEEIVISNKELTTARIQNFKRLSERRTSFSLGVEYETPNEKLKKIPAEVKKIITEQEGARFDRAHFKSFGDSALVFEVVFYIESGNYSAYMDIQEKINLKIKEFFEAENINFAYPTRKLFIEKA